MTKKYLFLESPQISIWDGEIAFQPFEFIHHLTNNLFITNYKSNK